MSEKKTDPLVRQQELLAVAQRAHAMITQETDWFEREAVLELLGVVNKIACLSESLGAMRSLGAVFGTSPDGNISTANQAPDWVREEI